MALDVQVSPEETRVLLESGYLATERREYAKAKEIFEGCIALGRGADVAEVALANLDLVQGKPKDAEKALRAAVKSRPENAYAWALLGEILHTQGKKQESLEALSKAKSLDASGAFGGMAGAMEEAVNQGADYSYKTVKEQEQAAKELVKKAGK
jgi:tetratricopeptide (TPR) repeat protein